MMLNDVAVIYGGGGAIGGAARAFARIAQGGLRGQGVRHDRWEQWRELLASTTHARRVSTLEETASVAAFVGFDEASAMTERPST